MMTQSEMRDVIQAAIDRKPIQWRCRDSGSEWVDRPDPSDILFNFCAYDYRVKPEAPEVRWLNLYRDGSARVSVSRDDAARWSNGNVLRTAVQFVELTPAVRAACEAAGIEVPNE